MNIPSIKFLYLEKLKLYHDYLAPNSVFEQRKKPYWQHEKIVLLWAYSEAHQHLFTSLSNKRIFELYGIDPDTKKIVRPSELEGTLPSEELAPIVRDLEAHSGKINYVKGNLAVNEFGTGEGNLSEGYPEKIRIIRKGLLLGEILHEKAYHPNFFNKNFRKYRWGINFLRFLIAVSALTLALVFINQILDLYQNLSPSLEKSPVCTTELDVWLY